MESFYYKKRRDAEAQRIFPFNREHPEYAELWPTSQPVAHIKNARRALYSPNLSQTLNRKSLRLRVSAFEIKENEQRQHEKEPKIRNAAH